MNFMQSKEHASCRRSASAWLPSERLRSVSKQITCAPCIGFLHSDEHRLICIYSCILLCNLLSDSSFVNKVSRYYQRWHQGPQRGKIELWDYRKVSAVLLIWDPVCPVVIQPLIVLVRKSAAGFCHPADIRGVNLH